jgi:hypothetical protein
MRVDKATPVRSHGGTERMRRRGTVLIVAASIALVVLAGVVAGVASASGGADEGAPIFLDKIPPGYRDWRLISVAQEEGDLHDIRAILGNDIAIKAYREGTSPFPEGAIIAATHWKHVPSEENNKIFGRAQSFVAGAPTSVQFMVKDTHKYATTGGWGFGHFIGRDEKQPGGKELMQNCFPCHNKIKARDLVFTRFAP